ncbi:hypothetical protein CDD81_5637 [Ophiocordyceps australis]|uniref:Cytochrome P450 n=1 Tax=Ophiocordyceps australis TaxID=1399860 RepID=A0A2C5Y7H5_9HYPO|nr:hypothetical protein CDD81_5637 [Ophiocordyceps australis]
MASLILIQAFTIFIFLLIYRRILSQGKAPLPPGPAPLPILGNMYDMPPPGTAEYKHWFKHKDKYGPISSVRLFNKVIVLIHDKQAAHDLCGRHSGRSLSKFALDICGVGEWTIGKQPDDAFRRHRKMISAQLGSKKAVSRFNNLQDVETKRFLVWMLNKPDKLVENLYTHAGSLILKIIYGYSIEPNKADPLVDIINQIMARFTLIFAPLTWAVDIIPLLEYLPLGFPGASFKRLGRLYQNELNAAARVPYEFAIDRISDSKDQNSYGFILAMIMFPEVQRKAQEEIDRVVGPNSLPSYEHQPHLPYIKALISEALRWVPIAPIGIPHATKEDMIYQGYQIPKERFMEPRNEPDPRSEVFGYGRRICPGRVLAESTIFLTIVRILAVFSIGKAVVNGVEIEVELEMSQGSPCHPKDFAYSIRPRSEQMMHLLRKIEQGLPWTEGDSAKLPREIYDFLSKDL